MMHFGQAKTGAFGMVCMIASWASVESPAQEVGPDAPYDLVLIGGTVIDPANSIHGRKDVAVRDGRIAAVADRLFVRGAL